MPNSRTSWSGRDELRGSMGVIFQDFVRYNLPAGDNIAVGRVEARDDHERIARAAGRSLADQSFMVIEGFRLGGKGARLEQGDARHGGEWLWRRSATVAGYMDDCSGGL